VQQKKKFKMAFATLRVLISELDQEGKYTQIKQFLSKTGSDVTPDQFVELMQTLARAKTSAKYKIWIAKMLIEYADIVPSARIVGVLQLLAGNQSCELEQYVLGVRHEMVGCNFNEYEIRAIKSVLEASTLEPEYKAHLESLLGKEETIDFPALFELLQIKEPFHVVKFLEEKITNHKSRILTNEQFATIMARMGKYSLTGQEAVQLTKLMIENMNKYRVRSVEEIRTHVFLINDQSSPQEVAELEKDVAASTGGIMKIPEFIALANTWRNPILVPLGNALKLNMIKYAEDLSKDSIPVYLHRLLETAISITNIVGDDPLYAKCQTVLGELKERVAK